MLVLLLLTCVLNSSALDCFIDTSNRKCTFGSKTPYRFIANLNNSRLNYEGCREQKIWMMIRHGTRHPTKKNIRLLLDNIFDLRDRILESHKKGHLRMNDESVRAFYNWDTDFAVDFDAKLAPEGEDEMANIASRMQARFPTLFPPQNNQILYDFNFTPTQRARQSAKYFMFGLFGRHETETEYPTRENKTFVLRFYKYCQRWQNEVRLNSKTQKEKREFENGEVVKAMLENISNKLGFEVDNEQVKLMRMMCVFETALNKSINSPWCDVFSFDQLKILEYVEDLKYYWNDGYGHSLTHKQACPALVDMFKFFESSKRIAALYFSHSGTILKLLGILNIAKEERHLTHDTFVVNRDSRKWRTSLIDTFASNIAFVLYDCGRDGPAILTMHQERAVYLPGCPKNRPCPLDLMKELYVDNEEECHFNEMCSWYNKTEL